MEKEDHNHSSFGVVQKKGLGKEIDLSKDEESKESRNGSRGKRNVGSLKGGNAKVSFGEIESEPQNLLLETPVKKSIEIKKNQSSPSIKSNNSDSLKVQTSKSELEKDSSMQTFFDSADPLSKVLEDSDNHSSGTQNQPVIENKWKKSNQRVSPNINSSLNRELPLPKEISSRGKDIIGRKDAKKSSNKDFNRIENFGEIKSDSPLVGIPKEVSFAEGRSKTNFSSKDKVVSVGFNKDEISTVSELDDKALEIGFANSKDRPNEVSRNSTPIRPSNQSLESVGYGKLRSFLNRPRGSSEKDQKIGQNQYPNSTDFLEANTKKGSDPVFGIDLENSSVRYLKTLEWIEKRGRVQGKGEAE